MSELRLPLAQIPQGPVTVPPSVRELTAGRKLEAVWVNGLGGLTFRDDGPGDGARYVKWVTAGTPEIDLAAEAARLRWALEHGAIAPMVLDQGSDASGSWLITAALAGESAVSPRWIAEPVTAARAIGAGLRQLHDTLPVAACPYRWDLATRAAQFEHRIRTGDGPADWAPAYRGLSIARVREILRDPPPVTNAVVCHGDPCAPNTLISSEGSFAAHVDLGDLGVGDPWADLAVAAWSTEWNYGPGFEQHVYEGYGCEADPERIAFYRLLWEVS
ncbi:MAG: aminoglycoside 3'-phosphotransferase [Leucobacter sp.]|nr:aminoglycoside 3'-phosphotransferase [Leucobacter sp.]